MTHCEFCEKPAEWRYWRGSYERFGCGEHIRWMRRLIALDLGPVPYQFEEIRVSALNVRMDMTCDVCKTKPSCASIMLQDDGKLYLNVIIGSAVGNTIPLRYEVVPSPQEVISMPHQEGALCDACIRGYGGVGMLVPVLPREDEA